MPPGKPELSPPSRPPHTAVLLPMVLALAAALLLPWLGQWKTTEIMELLHLQSSKEMALSGEWIVPDVGSRRPQASFSRVVLPDPLGPITPVQVGASWRLRPSKTGSVEEL